MKDNEIDMARRADLHDLQHPLNERVKVEAF
jgi:hypothetical protein